MHSGCPNTPAYESENARLLSPGYQQVHEPRANNIPPPGYIARRPPPVFVEQQTERGSYEVISSDNDRDSQVNVDTPLFHPPNRSKITKRCSTVLPGTTLPPTPNPPGLAGGTGRLARFEPVPVLPLVIHTLLCIAAFPLMYCMAPLADNLPVFWTRLIVGGIDGIVGLCLSVSLLDLSKRGIESALWATIIHESVSRDADGVPLSQLNYHTANSASPWAAIVLLYRRSFKHHGTGRSRRKNYDGTRWSLYIILFLLSVTVSEALSFTFGRVVGIDTRQVMQTDSYQEIKVIGDLSHEDIARAEVLNATFKGYMHTWSIIPFSETANLPKDRSFIIPRSSGSGVEDVVHFAETFTGQLVPGGTGFGTFHENTTAVWANAAKTNQTMDIVDNKVRIESGQIIRWPRWGERTVCQTMEEIPNNGLIIDFKRTGRSMTYGYVTKAAINGLLEYAEISNRSLAQLPPINFASYLDPGDELPEGVADSDVGMMGKWWDNGVAHQFKSETLDRGDSGGGWILLEIVLVRLNETYATNSQFPQYAPGGDAASRNRIGIDAALCVSEIRPHILDAYHSTAGLPTTRNFVEKGDVFTKLGKRTKEEDMQGVQHGLKSTGKWVTFSNAHTNARNMMLKDNGRDSCYISNPTLVSLTGGFGPDNYTKLLSTKVRDALGSADSQHLLPYLVGSQEIVAHAYSDKILAYTKVSWVALLAVLIVVLALGFIVSIFVPRLPLGLPRRDFGIFSWIAAIEGDSLINLPVQVGRYERLEDIERRAKDVPVKYAVSGEV